MSYAERHIAQETARLEAALAVANADSGNAIHRLLASESERVWLIHAKRSRIDRYASSARRVFRDVASFLAGQGGSDVFPDRLFVTVRRTFAGNSVQRHCAMSAFHAKPVRILSPG